MQQRARDTRRRALVGFTLVELLVVVVIIGIIISLVLVASADGVRRAEERATQTLITKLTEGLNDRIDALQNITAPINPTHRYLAAVCFPDPSNNSRNLPISAQSSVVSNSVDRRAQVIAQTDFIRAELPDVFFVTANTTDGAGIAANYPLNFAGRAYPTPAAYANSATYDPYLLPLGNFAPGLPYWYADLANGVAQLTPNPLPPPPFASNSPLPTTVGPPYTGGIYLPPPSGIFGASFAAAGGLYQNLYEAATRDMLAAGLATNVNYKPAIDGIDNNNNGLIDEIGEVAVVPASAQATFLTKVNARLASHTHKTARAEMLYAVLVGGLGPLGSVFNPDEFTAREVQDTDGDGLPEFVDAWGEPLQFFRWPIYFGTVAGSSDSQRGSNQYDLFSDPRELNPMDPNQLLVSPGWWANNSTVNVGLPFNTSGVSAPFALPSGATCSQAAFAFMSYFHLLADPYADTAGSPTGHAWDRSGQYARRSFFSKALILSGGPDKEVGVGLLGRDYVSLTGDSGASQVAFPSGLTMDAAAQSLILIENQASQTNPYARTGVYSHIPDGSSGTTTSTTTYLRNNLGLDDISNHNIAAPGTGVR